MTAPMPPLPEPTAPGTTDGGAGRGVLRDFPVGGLGERARAWLAGEITEAAEPRLAATVQILRDGPGGVEVFMLHRASTMVFAPSMLVFPGGGVDPRDADPALPWRGPAPSVWAAGLSLTQAQAREVVVAAVREIFEETGVLLAGPLDGPPLGSVRGPEWDAARRAVEGRELAFAELLERHGLALHADLLSLRGHWITPPFEPRRYDTAILAACLPAGQAADGRTSEAVSSGWRAPREVLDAHARGEVLMLPPTIVSLEQLLDGACVDEVLARAPEVWPISPDLVAGADGPVMRARVPETAR